MTKQETIAHAVRGSDGSRYVCLGFVEAINKARYLADEFPNVQFSVVELIERPADEPSRDPSDLITAAIDWAYCPNWGSYRGGPSMEDTCENLNIAVREYTGRDIKENGDEPWSIDEMRAAVNRT